MRLRRIPAATSAAGRVLMGFAVARWTGTPGGTAATSPVDSVIDRRRPHASRRGWHALGWSDVVLDAAEEGAGVRTSRIAHPVNHHTAVPRQDRNDIERPLLARA